MDEFQTFLAAQLVVGHLNVELVDPERGRGEATRAHEVPAVEHGDLAVPTVLILWVGRRLAGCVLGAPVRVEAVDEEIIPTPQDGANVGDPLSALRHVDDGDALEDALKVLEALIGGDGGGVGGAVAPLALAPGDPRAVVGHETCGG